MYSNLFQNFFTENKGLVITNTLLCLFMYPIEIVILSWLSGMIFFHVKEGNLRKFLYYASAFVIAILLLVFLNYLMTKGESYILPRLQYSVRRDMLNMIQEDRDYAQQLENGEIMSHMMKIPMYMYVNYTNVSNFVIPFVFAIFFFCIYMYYIHYSIGTITIVFFSIFIGLYLHYYHRTMQISSFRFEKENEMMNHFEDVLTNHDIIRMNNMFEYEKDVMNEKEQQFETILTNELNEINNIKCLFSVAHTIFLLLLIYYCCWLVIRHKIPLFKLIMLVSSVVFLLRTTTNLIRRVSDSITEFGPLRISSSSNSEKIPENTETEMKERIQRHGLTQFDIEIKHLSFSIQSKLLYKDINLSIPFRSNILITGSIGSGKSTLFRILMGEQMIPKNHIFFDGIDLCDLYLPYLRKFIYIMHQNVRLFRRSVLENIFYGISSESQEWLQKYQELEKLPIFKKIKSFLDVSDARSLSGGQKQIVLLLRCFFRKPKILLLDEPTASIDYQMKDLMIEILNIMKKNSTLLCISHDLSLIPIFQQHYRLSDGKLISLTE